MAEVRWFGQNDYEHLIVPELQALGLAIDTASDEPAKVTVVMNHDLAPTAWRYARRRRTALISYIWDLPPFRLGEGRSDHVLSLNGRLVTLPRIGPRYITRRGYYSRLHFVAGRAATVWTPSVATSVDVQRRFGLNAVPVQYCYNSRLFCPEIGRATGESTTSSVARHTSLGAAGREHPVESGGKRELSLLTVSRLTPPKNHEAAIRAAGRLGARVEIIGRGPAQPQLENLARSLDVRCRFRSGLSGDEIVEAYREATVVVCPSRFEGLGLTGIEGAICGTPVAASDIPAHREFLGPAAHFFPLDDDEALVRAIEQARVAGPPPTAHFASLTIPAAAQRFFDRLQFWL